MNSPIRPRRPSGAARATPIAERIERAARWPGHTLRENWKLGDYSVYALTVPPPGFKALHIRFISEPDAAAMLDVSASNDDPVFRATARRAIGVAATPEPVVSRAKGT